MLSTDQRLSCMGSMHLLVASVLVLERVTGDFILDLYESESSKQGRSPQKKETGGKTARRSLPYYCSKTTFDIKQCTGQVLSRSATPVGQATEVWF